MNQSKINPLDTNPPANGNGLTTLVNNGSNHDSEQELTTDEIGHKNPNRRRSYLIVLCFSLLSALCGLALILTWMLNYRPIPGLSLTDKDTLGNWHPVLMYIFMFILNIYSITLYRTHYAAPKTILKLTHALLNSLIIVMSLFGVYVMYKAHVDHNMSNFYSLHSWIGVTTNALFFASLIAGIFIFLLPTFGIRIRAVVMPYHRWIGALVFGFATLAVVTGITEMVIFQAPAEYSSFIPLTFVANFAAGFTLLAAVGVIYLLTTGEFLRPKRSDER